MTWPIATMAMLLWIGAWLCLAARYTAVRDGDALVQTFGQILPAFVVTTCLFAFLAAPTRGGPLSVVVLWLHHTSFWLLFAFLLTGQYFQVEAWWKIRRGMSSDSVRASYRRLWILTEIVPAPVALMIFLTGLRLIWQIHGETAPTRGNSMSVFWLQGLVLGFGLFFWDGILGYTPIVRGLWRRWEPRPADLPKSSQQAPSLVESTQLLVHVLSWPLVFLIGVFRWDSQTILTRFVEGLERWLIFLPDGWPDVTVAIVLWLLMGLLVGILRYFFKSTNTFRGSPVAR